MAYECSSSHLLRSAELPDVEVCPSLHHDKLAKDNASSTIAEYIIAFITADGVSIS